MSLGVTGDTQTNVRRRMLGERIWELPDPPVVYVSNERRGILSPRAVEGVPDLIVEVAEPATSVRDRGLKLQRYAATRVPHYWILDALEQTIEEYIIGEDGYGPPTIYRVGETFQPALFPGLSIEVARLWP